MNISRDSWHYRLWNFTYYLSPEKMPKYQTSLCSYINRIIFYPIPVLLGLIILFSFLGILFVIFLVIPNIATILSGYGILVPSEKYSKEWYEVIPFKRINVSHGKSIPMWGIVSFAWFIIIFVIMNLFFSETISNNYNLFISLFFIVLPASYFVFYILKTIYKWSGWGIVRAYIKAKRDKVCPIVNFNQFQ